MLLTSVKICLAIEKKAIETNTNKKVAPLREKTYLFLQHIICTTPKTNIDVLNFLVTLSYILVCFFTKNQCDDKPHQITTYR